MIRRWTYTGDKTSGELINNKYLLTYYQREKADVLHAIAKILWPDKSRENCTFSMKWIYVRVAGESKVEGQNIKNSMFCALFQNRMKLVPKHDLRLHKTARREVIWVFGETLQPYTWYSPSNPLYGKIPNFIFADMQKWVTPMNRAWKTDKKMVWFNIFGYVVPEILWFENQY